MFQEAKTLGTGEKAARSGNAKQGLNRRTTFLKMIPKFGWKNERQDIAKGLAKASNNVASNVRHQNQQGVSDAQLAQEQNMLQRRGLATPPTEPVETRKTVVGIGKNKKYAIGPGRGLPIRAFPDPQTRRCLQMYCGRNGITQRMLEQKYAQYKDIIEGRYHNDGMKKKWYDFSLDSVIEIFDNHRIEMVAYVILSHIFSKEYPGLPPHEGKDPRGLSFARFIIWSSEICRFKDYEMMDVFFRCLKQVPNIDPSEQFNMGFIPAFFKTIHRDFDTNKPLKYLIYEMLPHNQEGMKYSDLIRFAYKYPPLLFPVLDFQKMWRRKFYGERFWKERVAEAHARPNEYEDARSKFGVPSQDFNLFARIPSTKAAWRHAAINIVLDLMAAMSKTKTAPPWEKVPRELARKLLKDHFGYQKAYFFLELLDMRDEALVEELENVKAKALEKGQYLYDEWLKADFYHNPITGLSEWDNTYKADATVGINFNLDLEVGPSGGHGQRAPGILKKKDGEGDWETSEEERLQREFEEKQEMRRYKKMRKILKKKKKRLIEQGLIDEAREIIIPPKWGAATGGGGGNEDGGGTEEEAAGEEEGKKVEDHTFADKFKYDKTKRRGGKQNIMVPDDEKEEEERNDRITTDFMVMERRADIAKMTYETNHPEADSYTK
eukprot:CAMPEP_0118637068 /NCGR_PEP_ID=MMETSP0785-20121206/2958_1 /TAXON_ID=91992 /ORGANISM="Bolidomonas pacifica, Strain CCMP 1866" /LENGTH=661 /DNA_ID=CAMNT_0006528235 /DNA_START=88 /DNA_END=2070 /DNA_ORIENTATION=-